MMPLLVHSSSLRRPNVERTGDHGEFPFGGGLVLWAVAI